MTPTELQLSRLAHKQVLSFFLDEASKSECDAALRKAFSSSVEKQRPLNADEISFLDSLFGEAKDASFHHVASLFVSFNKENLVKAFLSLEENVLLIADAYVENDESRREFSKAFIIEDIRQQFLSPIVLADASLAKALHIARNAPLPVNTPLL